MKLIKVPRPDYREVEYASYRMNTGPNQVEVLIGYNLKKWVLVPVYVCLQDHNDLKDLSAWCVRTFEIEFPYETRKDSIFNESGVLIHTHPILVPKLSMFICPDNDSSNAGKLSIVKNWESLTHKAVSYEDLKQLLGI